VVQCTRFKFGTLIDVQVLAHAQKIAIKRGIIWVMWPLF